MPGWDIKGNVVAEVDMYVGGVGMAVVGHYADQAAPQKFLAEHNVTNGEALFGLDILAGAFLRSKFRGNRAKRMLDASVAYSVGALTDRYLKGRFSAVPATTTTGTTVTGLEVMDPNGGWGNGGVDAGGGYDGGRNTVPIDNGFGAI